MLCPSASRGPTWESWPRPQLSLIMSSVGDVRPGAAESGQLSAVAGGRTLRSARRSGLIVFARYPVGSAPPQLRSQRRWG